MLLRRRGNLRKEPRQQRSSFTVDAILDAAELILEAGDGEALQMAGLAKRAGVSSGSLYQYFPDRTAVLTSLLERIWLRAVNDFRLRFENFRARSLAEFLDEISTTVAELAHRKHALRVTVHKELRRVGYLGQQIDVSPEWVTFLAEHLRIYVPEASEERLMEIGRFMVWTADGVVDGVARWPEVTGAELRRGLFAIWKGISA